MHIPNYYDFLKCLNRNKPFLALIFIATIFLLSGMPECINNLTSGVDHAANIEYPRMSGLAPLTIPVYSFGFLGALLFTYSGNNFKTNPALAQKQFIAAIILVGSCFVCIELLFKFAMNAF